MKQQKVSGIVVMDRSKYINKYFDILRTKPFIKLTHGSTKSIENKINKN